MNLQTCTTVTQRLNRICYTDRLYAKLTMRGNLVVELTRDRFTSLSALLATLRSKAPGIAGLCMLTVRNMSRGWKLERPLMLYPQNCRQTSMRDLHDRAATLFD